MKRTPQLPLIPPGFGAGMRRALDTPINGADARRARKAANAGRRKAAALRKGATTTTEATP